VQSGHFADPGRTTVREFLEHWLDSVTPSLRESTAASYRASCANYVTPHLGHVRLASLTPGHLTKLYATLLAGGGAGGRRLSPRTVRYTHTIVGKACKDAAAGSPGTQAGCRRQANPGRRQASATYHAGALAIARVGVSSKPCAENFASATSRGLRRAACPKPSFQLGLQL
jgi:integrase